MFFARRTAVLRLTSMAALLVSAVLTADQLNPGRAFCPLAEACAAASKSDLGSFFGVPTSMIGMAAFGALFLLTLLPVEWARPLLRPAGLLAAFAGLGFVAYQMFVLDAFCPLCVVADGAGFLAGLITLTWPRPPTMRDGSLLPSEPISKAMAWTLAAALVTAVPFAWPRDEIPAWVEIEPLTEMAFEDTALEDMDPEDMAPEDTALEGSAQEPEDGALERRTDQGGPLADTGHRSTASVAGGNGATATPAATGVVVVSPLETGVVILSPAPHTPSSELAAAPAASASPDEHGVVILAPAPHLESDGPTESAGEAAEVTAALDAPPTAESEMTEQVESGKSKAPVKKRARPTGPLLVEYLNAYCPHCRKTLRRLEQVLEESKSPVRKRRVYTWTSKGYPLWARACAYAQTVDREEAMFRELTHSRNQSRREVYAAARRAGLDMRALQQAVSKKKPPKRLVRDRSLVQRAGLRMLPTIDVGSRRLQGEQSASELRDALLVAQRKFMAQAN